MKILIIALTAGSGRRNPGLSGGDRIWIEFAKRCSKVAQTYIITTMSGWLMLRRYVSKEDINKIYINVIAPILVDKGGQYSFIKELLYMSNVIIRGLINLSRIEGDVIISASEFPADVIPIIVKKLLRNKRVIWVSSFYIFAPNPFQKRSPYRGIERLRNLAYYLLQRPIYFIVRKYANMVWVTNELDRWRFIDKKRLTSNNVIAVKGGVDTSLPSAIPEPTEKRFDAVFIGRFHPQKGVRELIDIWNYVVKVKPNAKLAMIGEGYLEEEIKKKIKTLNLENNITLYGFTDGSEKIKIFKSAKIVLHPAIYDSGGMAPCEAMACGLPGVSFDLPALRTYYPKGMLKTPCFDLKGFAENILKLLNDQDLYMKLSKEAIELAKEWDWDKRAKELLDAIISLIKN
jgi:glycosyltransferase involved in cell wall biosynthesis